MESKESLVRVWVGFDLLQGQLMKQMLRDNGIECFSPRDRGVIPTGALGEIGVWVGQEDEARARALLEQWEEEMSARRERDLPEEDPGTQG